MNNININISNVVNANNTLQQPEETVRRVRSKTSSIRNNLYSKLASRNNIDDKFSTAIMQLKNVEQRINKLQKTVNKSVMIYRETDRKLMMMLPGTIANGFGNVTLNETNSLKFHDTKVKNRDIKKTTKASGKNAYTGKSKSIVSGTKSVIKKIYKSYQNKGTVYELAQYGKVLAGIAKIIKGAGAFSSVAGAAVGILVIASGANDVIKATNNIIHLSKKEYDQLDKQNFLKDVLVSNGKEFGTEIFHNEKTGEKIGETLYVGVSVVNLLDSTDKLLKSFGKVNTAVTGAQKSSFVWGEAENVAIDSDKIKFSFSADYFIRKMIGLDPNGKANLLYEAGKGTYKTIKKSTSVGKDIGKLATE